MPSDQEKESQMAMFIGRNLSRIFILILAAGLVMGVIYALSFTSIGPAPNQGAFPGEGQFEILPDSFESEAHQEGGQGQGFGQGQGDGFGGGRRLGEGQGLGQGRGHGGGDEFSLERGLPEFGAHLIAVAIIVAIVYFLQHLAKRRQRVSPAS